MEQIRCPKCKGLVALGNNKLIEVMHGKIRTVVTGTDVGILTMCSGRIDGTDCNKTVAINIEDGKLSYDKIEKGAENGGEKAQDSGDEPGDDGARDIGDEPIDPAGSGDPEPVVQPAGDGSGDGEPADPGDGGAGEPDPEPAKPKFIKK